MINSPRGNEYKILNEIYEHNTQFITNYIEEFFKNIINCKQIILKDALEASEEKYKDFLSNFELGITSIEASITDEDLTSKSDLEIKRLKRKFNDTMRLIEDREFLSNSFNSISNTLEKKLTSLSIKHLQKENFTFSIKKNSASLFWKDTYSSILNITREGTSYRSFCSEEIFENELEMSIKINKINSTFTSSYWNYAIGLIKNGFENNDQSSYFNNSVVLQSNGYINNQFSGGSDTLNRKTDIWNKDDIISVSRDNEGNVYFAINDKPKVKCFSGITGEMRVVLGVSSNMVNDEFEIEECSKTFNL